MWLCYGECADSSMGMDENHLARLFLFNLTSKDITHKQIRQAHTKSLPSQPSPLLFTYKIHSRHDSPPNCECGGSILLLLISSKLSKACFLFLKYPKIDPISFILDS